MIKPLRNYIVVRPIKEEPKTNTGLYYPNPDVKEARKGEVMETGTGEITEKGNRKEMTLKKGDVVLYPIYAGQLISLQNGSYEKVLLMRESEILAKLEEE